MATMPGMDEQSPIPVVSGVRMAAVDRAMAEVCGLDLMQVMEIAGRSVAIQARMLTRAAGVGPHRIAVLCGSGGNGGDAMVCARYLAGWGWQCALWLATPSAELRGLAAHQLQICRRLGLAIHEPGEPLDPQDAELIVDGIFGFGLSAPVRGHARQMIVAANAHPAPTLAIDLPSGIHATTGELLGTAIDAHATLTLGLPKLGLVRGMGPSHAGSVTVADIGVPASAYEVAGIPLTSAFRNAEFIALEGRTLLPVAG